MSLKKNGERLLLKAFCNKLMTGLTKNDTNIKKIILLHISGEEPSWQNFKENRPSLCEKWTNIMWSEGGKEHPTCNKKMEG